MTRTTVFLAVAMILAAATSLAQIPQPYAGMQNRPLKALSDEQLADLKEGRGMGLALAGELNGYPGPKHVLELAKELNLTDAQRERTQQLFDAMKAETIPLGQQLIAAETDLDRQFSGRTITPASLTAATTTIGATQGTLRATHLKYHLAMMDVLTPAQIARYGELRGYGAAGPAGPFAEHAQSQEVR
ncbi:MAG TPA: periplasmic heavy metal sensor [Pseudolabrys sp.]|nr:periplasmic heavy metal sensor [Pseudolabrys sp.]